MKQIVTTAKPVRVFASNGVNLRVAVPVTTAPRSIVGALSCCCKDS